jgi:hypothetical protein
MARPAAARPAAAPCGPYQTERQAAGAARGIYAAAPGVPLTAGNHQMLTRACAAAGVELGDWDRRILAWLAGWEPSTCAVIAGIIGRAAATPAPPRAAAQEEGARWPGPRVMS